MESIHKGNGTLVGDNRLLVKRTTFPRVDKQSTDKREDDATQKDSHSEPNLPPLKVAHLNKDKQGRFQGNVVSNGPFYLSIDERFKIRKELSFAKEKSSMCVLQ